MVGVQVRFRRRLLVVPHGQPLELQYAVKNRLRAPVFIVTDPATVALRGVAELHVILGENPIPDDEFYFEYSIPRQRRIAPGAEARLRLTLDTVRSAPTVDRDGIALDTPVTLVGPIDVYLTVGYTLERFRPRTADPWTEFIRHQALTSPAFTTVQIT